MLIRSIYTRALTSVISYNYELKRQPVQLFFANNYKAARTQIQKITTQYQMNKQQGRRLFHFYPKVFKPQSKQFGQFRARIQYIRKLTTLEGKKSAIGRVFQKILFESNYLAFKFSENQFNDVVETIEKYFQNQIQIQKIFTACPNLANPKFSQILQQKLSVLSDYLQISNEQSMKIFEASPFLVSASTRRIRQAIVVISKVYNFSNSQIVQLMKDMGEVFTLARDNLASIHKTHVKWGLTRQQIKSAFIKNSLLFFNYPQDVMPHKKKILKYLNFTTEMAQIMMQKYPQIIISSVRSLQEKAIFITKRLDLKLNKDTIQLLTFNFNKTLRPRGQILVRSKTLFNNQNILSYMKMSDAQFASKTEIPIQRLNEQVAKYPITQQMDFKKSKKIQMNKTKQKFLQIVSTYRK